MKGLVRLTYGTIRPIALLAWIPPLVGAILAGERLGIGVFVACVGTVISVGFANAFNNLIDRWFDRLNPQDLSLAVSKPIAAYYLVLFLLPLEAVVLRCMPYHHELLAMLFYTSYWYSYLLGRIPVVKRMVVAGTIAATSFLAVYRPNFAVWLWASLLFAHYYIRERRKDGEDVIEDNLHRYSWMRELRIDWWIALAPILAAGTLLWCLWHGRHSLQTHHLVVAAGLAVFVWSYIQTRYRYGDYRARLHHRTMAGLLGIVISIVAMMPSYLTPMAVLLVLANAVTVCHRSFLPKIIRFSRTAILHDAYLWASVPILAMLMLLRVDVALTLISAIIFLGVVIKERLRLTRLLAQAS